MKILHFTFRDKHYMVDEEGRINANGINCFSDTWKFLGGMHHHWCSHISRPLNDVFNNPKILENCLGVDLDHGTTRVWGGSYNGKLPRINNVYITEKN